RGMHDFRVELEAIPMPPQILDGGKLGIVGDCHGFEAARQGRQFVSVRIPHLQALGQILKKWTRLISDREGPFAIFALLSGLHFASEILREQLDSETNAEHRDWELKNG